MMKSRRSRGRGRSTHLGSGSVGKTSREDLSVLNLLSKSRIKKLKRIQASKTEKTIGAPNSSRNMNKVPWRSSIDQIVTTRMKNHARRNQSLAHFKIVSTTDIKDEDVAGTSNSGSDNNPKKGIKEGGRRGGNMVRRERKKIISLESSGLKSLIQGFHSRKVSDPPGVSRFDLRLSERKHKSTINLLPGLNSGRGRSTSTKRPVKVGKNCL